MIDENNRIKIIDFGFSITQPRDKKLNIFCGTPSYMAPEIVKRTPYLGKPADVWSLGILLYALICGKFPFKSPRNRQLFKRITS
jgi:MAP/microtubule affinity-regulating kinase